MHTYGKHEYAYSFPSKLGHIDSFKTHIYVYMTRILFAFCYSILGGAMMLVARKNADGKRWLYNGKQIQTFSVS